MPFLLKIILKIQICRDFGFKRGSSSSGSSIIIRLNYLVTKVLDQKLDYLHYNPVVAGFVSEPWEYLYSSARDYSGTKGLLNVILI